MTPVNVFLTGILLAAVASGTVVWYLKPSLQGVLLDLCGTEERAAFWTAFSNVTIGLTPLIFAMHYRPGETQMPVVFEIGSQLEFALGGLLLSVVVLGFVLSRFIIKQPAHA